MISSWLGDTPLETFRVMHYGKSPFAQPSTARDARDYLNWQTLADLLSAPTDPDVMVVRNGRLLNLTPPSTPAEFRNMFGGGCSFVVREAERHDAGIRSVADAFTIELEGTVTIQVFATPAETHGFGWHYDCEEVFIAQTAGTKEYFLRKNTVNPRPTIDSIPTDMHFERETGEIVACTLAAGDLLYIPRGWWHMGRAIDNSLGLSVGVLPPEARGNLTDEEVRLRGRHGSQKTARP